MLFLVLLPQALRQVIPIWVNTATEIVKASTLLSVIGVGELLLKTQEVDRPQLPDTGVLRSGRA